MARHPKDVEAAAELGRRLTHLRSTRTPAPSFLDMSRRMYAELSYDATPEWIRQAHAGKVDPHTADIDFLFALARGYGVPFEELGPVVAQRLSKVLLLAGPYRGDPGPDGGSDLGFASSIWSASLVSLDARRDRFVSRDSAHPAA